MVDLESYKILLFLICMLMKEKVMLKNSNIRIILIFGSTGDPAGMSNCKAGNTENHCGMDHSQAGPRLASEPVQ